MSRALLALLLLLAASPVAAQADAGVADASVDAAVPEPELPPAHRPRISVRLEPGSRIHTGELVRVLLSVDTPRGDDVTVPSQSFTPLELHHRSVREVESNGRVIRHFTVELIALAPGAVELAPIELRVLTEDGLVGTVRSEPIHLQVDSVLGNEPDAQPKPASAPRHLEEEDLRPLYLIGTLAAMALGALVALLVRRWWNRRPKPVVPPPPPRPAWELAFEKLEALRHDGPAMISEGRVGPWIDALSDTVREYLGHRYGFEGLECTSDEVIRRITGLRVQSLAPSELQVFLGECDLVKFAQASMTVEQAETMFRHAHRIVRATIPGHVGFGPAGGAP